MTLTKSPTSLLRAVWIALALGGTALATPAMAASPSLSFNFGIGGGGSDFSFTIGKGGKHIRRDCLNDREITRGLRRSGWDDIRITDSGRRRATVEASWHRDDFRFTVNRCSGKASDLRRVDGHGHHGGRDDDDDHHGGDHHDDNDHHGDNDHHDDNDHHGGNHH